MSCCFGVVGVAVRDPHCDLRREFGGVGNAAVEALAGENGQFGLSKIEPAAVLGRIVPCEPLDDPAGLGWFEHFIQ